MSIPMFRSLMFVAMLASSALASDYYADPVNGLDTNSGTTPSSPWRTLTYATGATYTFGAAATIHLAPGVYGPGETYPLASLSGQRIVGDHGSAVTILDGGSRIFTSSYQQLGHVATYTTEIRGVTLRNASDAAIAATYVLHLVDVEIEGCGQAGIELGANATGLPNDRNLSVTLERVSIHGCPLGISAGPGLVAGTGSNTVNLDQCTIRGASASGLLLQGAFSDAYTLTRCTIDQNAGHGIETLAECTQAPSLTIADCLVTRNGGDGVHAGTPPMCSTSLLALTIQRSTIASNMGSGLFAHGGWVSFHATLVGTILYGNAIDVDTMLTGTNNWVHASFGDVGGGQFAGSNGNIAADPLFVDAANGDFRSRFASPCIDAGDPSTPAGALDVDGVTRQIDGNLDTHENVDMGAHEFQPLRLVSTGQIGSPFELDLEGASLATTTVYFSRLAPVAPQSTPFGDFDLDPTVHGTFFSASLGANPPLKFPARSPTTQWSWAARSRSRRSRVRARRRRGSPTRTRCRSRSSRSFGPAGSAHGKRVHDDVDAKSPYSPGVKTSPC